MPKIKGEPKMVAAVDPSLGSAAVAYGVVGCEPQKVSLELFTATKPMKDVEGRIARWEDHAGQMLECLKRANPFLVMIEGYSFGSKGQATLDLAEFGGILRKFILDKFVLVEVSPSSLKKFITGNGVAGKTEMIAEIAKRYGVMFKTNDEYDAFGLHLMAQCYIEPKLMQNNHQREVMNKLKGLAS